MDGRLDQAFAGKVEGFLKVRAVPTIEPAMCRPLSTTSKIGVGKSPGGRPTRAMVPPRRAMPMAWPKALLDTAVTSTPWAPPMSRWSTSTGSSCRALTVRLAPSLRASSSLASSMSMAATCRPMALAYCTATWPRPPMPEIATHWPGRALVCLSPL